MGIFHPFSKFLSFSLVFLFGRYFGRQGSIIIIYLNFCLFCSCFFFFVNNLDFYVNLMAIALLLNKPINRFEIKSSKSLFFQQKRFSGKGKGKDLAKIISSNQKNSGFEPSSSQPSSNYPNTPGFIPDAMTTTTTDFELFSKTSINPSKMPISPIQEKDYGFFQEPPSTTPLYEPGDSRLENICVGRVTINGKSRLCVFARLKNTNVAIIRNFTSSPSYKTRHGGEIKNEFIFYMNLQFQHKAQYLGPGYIDNYDNIEPITVSEFDSLNQNVLNLVLESAGETFSNYNENLLLYKKVFIDALKYILTPGSDVRILKNTFFD